MCGVAGVFRFSSPPEEGEIRAMTRALAHRGPDGEGVRLAGPVALGHRRLSIIDAKGGAQPMATPDGRAFIVFNGEIYNYQELAGELAEFGLVPRTRSDTEILLLAWRAWGEGCLDRLRGMFAFAVVDLDRRALFLARDAQGIKPLYYRVLPEGLAFASELNALSVVRAPSCGGSLQALDYYLRYQYIPAPFTIYEGVRKLSPGHFLVMNLDTPAQIPDPRRWSAPRFAPEPEPTPEEGVALVREAVLEAVSAQLVADVPFGVLLSGGLDSTLVAWAMREATQGPVRAFAIGFEDPQADETAYARTAARKLGLSLRERVVREDMLLTLPATVAHLGEPFGDSSILPTWQVCALAREHVPMVLSGDGGDEAFGGYHAHAAWMASRDERDADPLAWERYVLTTPRPFREGLWKPEFAALMDTPCPAFVQAADTARGLDRLAQVQAVDLATYLPGDILTKVDMASMAHGLEVRPPLLDPAVLRAAARLPLAQRFCPRGGGGKLVLKRLLTDIGFEKDFVYRRKQGFAIPRERWFMPGRTCRAMLLDLFDDPGSAPRRLFARPAVDDLLARHTPAYDLSGILWLLLVFGLWSRTHPEVNFA